MEYVQLLSIAGELLIAIWALVLAVKFRRLYGVGLAVTFGIYVFYDLAKLFSWEAGSGWLTFAFLLATLSALLALWGIYKRQ